MLFVFIEKFHLKTSSCIASHVSLSFCLTISGANIFLMLSRDNRHIVSLSNWNVEAAIEYSSDNVVLKTPLSSVCQERNIYRQSSYWLLCQTVWVKILFHFKWYDVIYPVHTSLWGQNPRTFQGFFKTFLKIFKGFFIYKNKLYAS